MGQAYLIDPDGPQRDALVFALREVGVVPEVVSSASKLPGAWSDARPLLLLLAQSQFAEFLRHQTRLPKGDVRIWALLEPGSFPGLIEALHLGAVEVINRDRPLRDLAALVRAELAQKRTPAPEAEGTGITVEVAGREGNFHVAPERLIGLLAQMCEDISRLKRRYDAEQGQRRRVEQALVESEAFYQSLVETLPLALFRKDLEGRISFANQQFCDVLKRPASEILGRSDFDLFPHDLAEKYRADDVRVMQSERDFETTEEFRTPSGELRHTHVVKTPVYDPNGTLVGIQGVFSDVTDRIQTEAALERERYLLDSLMNNSPDNIYFKDLQGKYLRINPAKAHRSNLTDPADAIGRSDFDFFPPVHAQAALTDELKVLQSGEPLLAKEELIEYVDGSRAWMSTTKLPLKDRQGRVIGTFGVSHDITPLKDAQEALRRAAAAADAANRAKSDFVANMSHEIRTPLNAVLGMTELVLGTPLTPVQRDYLRLVHESGESLLSVINDILDFSKIEAGKLHLESAAFEFREFLGDTLQSMGLRAHRKGLELVGRIAPDIPEVLEGDANRVRQVVVNLIGNAIKFTDAGEVLLNVSFEPRAPQSHEASPSGKQDRAEDRDGEPIVLHFQVSDTGIGIPLEKFHSIFQAFEQADASTTRKFGGTGLGLAISARLVELMGGRIWVDSEVGRGSTFHFTVQFRRTSEVAPDHQSAAPELLQGLRVLVVDDNSTNRLILAEMLSSWGMTPVLVSSADEAMQELRAQAAQETPYSLVVTDVNMPEASGFDLVEAAQQEGTLCRGIIVMLTSSDRSEDLQACQHLGVDTYLIKPIKQSELFNAILQALGARHSEDWKTATVATHRMAKKSLQILLAEDSVINQKLAVGLLERWGHRVEVANNGAEALARVKESSFDLVLMDVQMPELDGLDATRAIREWERTQGKSGTPIVAMTAHALQGDRERCLAAGMDDYVSKPIRTENLFQTIERLSDTDEETENSPGNISSVQETHRPANNIESSIVVEDSIVPSESAVRSSAPGDMVNWERARQVVGRDEALLRDIADAFCQETPRVWQKLQAALAEGDVKLFIRSVHTLKSSLGTFGIAQEEQRALDLERGARTSGEIPAAEAVEPLGIAVNSAISEITKFLNS